MKARQGFIGIFVLAFFMIATYMYYEHQYKYKSDKLMKHGCDCDGSRSSSRYDESTNFLDMRSIINLPAWLRNDKEWNGMLMKNTSLEKLNVTKGIMPWEDNEEAIGWENFFFGMSGGLMLELGAVDGQTHSRSLLYEKSFDWRTILIEADPSYAAELSKNRPNALNLNVAVCGKPAKVHYFSNGGHNGILEFMSQGWLKQCYATVLKIPKNGSLDMEKLMADKHVSQIQCLPLVNVLTPFKINHVNFFVLDVEGGELDILKTIDFKAIRFDVIVLETNRYADDPAETKPYVEAVSKLMTSHGYVSWGIRGRNSWFLHPDFKPSAKPKNKLVGY